MSNEKTFARLQAACDARGAGFLVLFDPDKESQVELPRLADQYARAGVDAFLIGGSLLHAPDFDGFVSRLKRSVDLPVIGFPGSLSQISAELDAILYLSVISSRNPEYLFGQHVHAAPILRRLGVEPISTGYMLVESGRTTTAQYMIHSLPLPRHKPEIAAATGLAAEYLGMKVLYADAGSGAEAPVPEDMIRAVSETCSIPLIVGGGLRSPESVARAVGAGANFIVVGHAVEERRDPVFVAEMAAAAHVRVAQPL